MPDDYTDPDQDPTVEQLLSALIGVVYQIRDVVLDLQARQKEMDARQQAIKQKVEEAPAMKPLIGG